MFTQRPGPPCGQPRSLMDRLIAPKPMWPTGWRGWLMNARRVWAVLRFLGKIVRALLRLVRRGWAHRRMLAPVYAAVTLLTFGAALHQSGPFRAAGTAAALAALFAAWLGWRLHRNWISRALGLHIDDGAPRWVQIIRLIVPGTGGSWRAMKRTVPWAWCTYTAAATWFIGTAYAGLTRPWFPGMWLAILGGSGISWWRHYRVRPIQEIPLHELMARWSEKVARKEGPIPGSALDAIDPLTIEGQVVAHTAEGELDDDGVLTCVDVTKPKVAQRVALIYRTKVENIAIEPTDSGEAHRFRWWFFTLDPLEKVVHWAGPNATFDPETGLARIGRYRDGKPAHIRFYRAGFGVVFDALIGTTGGGKSEAENMRLSIERESPLMVSLVGDPQFGQSLPAWKDAVHGYALGPMQTLTMMRALRAEAEELNRYLAAVKWTDMDGYEVSGVPYMDPLRHNGPNRIGDRDLKIICVTICEAGKMLAIPEFKELAEEASELFRKCGILLRIDIQGVLMDQMKSRRFRKMMFGGNTSLFRSDDRLDQGVAFGGKKFTGDPCSIPSEFSNGSTTAGMAYVYGPEARPAAMRYDLCENPHRLARQGELTPWEPLSREMRAWIADEPGVRDGGLGKPDSVVRDIADGKAGKVTKKATILGVVQKLDKPASTGDIAKKAETQFSTTSKSLGELADEGLVERVVDPATGKVRTGMWFKPATEPTSGADGEQAAS